MKRYLFLIVLVSALVSCQQESEVSEDTSTQTGIETNTGHASGGVDDFSDLKKKDDESCDTEEDIKKKLEEDLKKQEEGKNPLLGGAGCATDEEAKPSK